jgi:hypothetical protein
MSGFGFSIFWVFGVLGLGKSLANFDYPVSQKIMKLNVMIMSKGNVTLKNKTNYINPLSMGTLNF